MMKLTHLFHVGTMTSIRANGVKDCGSYIDSPTKQISIIDKNSLFRPNTLYFVTSTRTLIKYIE